MANRNNRSVMVTPKAREMATLMAQWEGSGERMKDFAARHGIKLSTFSSWRQDLRRRMTKPAARTEFVEIGGTGAAQFELSLPNGVRLRVPNGFDAAALERLLGVLGRC